MAWSILNSDADISSQTLAYTVPVGYEGRLSASFCNRSTSSTATVTMWVVPLGGVVGNEHLKESGTTLGLAGTSQATLERFFVAPAGTMVYVQASNTNVSCQIQGDVVTESTGSSDGTSSITYGSSWSGANAKLSSANGFVTLSVAVSASPPTSSTLLTLPTSFRPSVAMTGVACSYSSPTLTSGGILHGAVDISTAGVVTPSYPAILSGTDNYTFYIHTAFKA